ncbi:MAG: energy transducer TonB [Phycisphaerales bacterium]|nr:energy transducer TonB [Phycisphaerales bacterium]
MTNKPSIFRRAVRSAFVFSCAVMLTGVFFLVLPFMQAISAGPMNDTEFRTIETIDIPPPPPPPEEEPEEEEQPEEEPPPELQEEIVPIDLNMLEGLLNNTLSDGLLGGDFQLSLNTATSAAEDVDALFALDDLDQKPRAVYQPAPTMDIKMRKRAPGTVYVIFIVDKDGRVVEPKVQRSTDAIFEPAALRAVQQWKFEPGQRNGKPVRFRMRVPITFPKG